MLYQSIQDSGEYDLQAIDNIFKVPKTVEIDRGRSTTSKLLDKILKTVVILVFTSIVAGSIFMSKYYLLEMVYSRQTGGQEMGLKWALFTLVMSTELLTAIYTLMVWLFSVDISSMKFTEIFVDYWLIWLSDGLASAADVLLQWHDFSEFQK